MTLTKGMLAAARLGRADLPLICGRLNRALVEAGRHRVFVTMSLGVLDETNLTFRHVRAGHNPPMVWRAATGICEFLKPPGIGLGLTRAAAFERHMQEHLVQLHAGDALVLYSDGLVECMNEAHEQFGEERLEETLKAWGPLDAGALRQRIVDEARRFRGQADPHDDLTVMVVKARGGAVDSVG
jgi:sigma-B regulation protein RsbU (phosphoserine phosphatase)